jgi:hypothetical protein
MYCRWFHQGLSYNWCLSTDSNQSEKIMLVIFIIPSDHAITIYIIYITPKSLVHLEKIPNKSLKILKGIRQYIFLLFHFKEILKLYVNLLYRFCVTWLKIICCPPSWINFYLIGDFSDVISRVTHIKLHLNDQITLSLVWKVVRQFFISNSYWSIWFWTHNNQLLYG